LALGDADCIVRVACALVRGGDAGEVYGSQRLPHRAARRRDGEEGVSRVHAVGLRRYRGTEHLQPRAEATVRCAGLQRA
jgi:hypothetical protein